MPNWVRGGDKRKEGRNEGSESWGQGSGALFYPAPGAAYGHRVVRSRRRGWIEAALEGGGGVVVDRLSAFIRASPR